MPLLSEAKGRIVCAKSSQNSSEFIGIHPPLRCAQERRARRDRTCYSSPEMDINVLVLNVGNSRLAMGAFISGELQSITRISHAQRNDWPAAIEQLWKKLSSRDDAAVVGSTVNPPL